MTTTTSTQNTETPVAVLFPHFECGLDERGRGDASIPRGWQIATEFAVVDNTVLIEARITPRYANVLHRAGKRDFYPTELTLKTADVVFVYSVRDLRMLRAMLAAKTAFERGLLKEEEDRVAAARAAVARAAATLEAGAQVYVRKSGSLATITSVSIPLCHYTTQSGAKTSGFVDAVVLVDSEEGQQFTARAAEFEAAFAGELETLAGCVIVERTDFGRNILVERGEGMRPTRINKSIYMTQGMPAPIALR